MAWPRSPPSSPPATRSSSASSPAQRCRRVTSGSSRTAISPAPPRCARCRTSCAGSSRNRFALDGQSTGRAGRDRLLFTRVPDGGPMIARGTWVPFWIALAVVVSSEAARAQDWRSYGGDASSAKYSPLAQIDAASFSKLAPAWTWRSPENDVVKAHPELQTWAWESTPLVVDGVLYTSTSLSQVAAVNAATGKTLWTYDPQTWKGGRPPNQGFVHRGVAYWARGNERRILLGTGDGYLIALDARTGKPVSGFGKKGRIDLTEGLGRPVDRQLYAVTSPPVICRDVVVVGASILDYPLKRGMPRGDLRGFDVRTGEQLWIFHAVPTEGEFGVDTWDKESW